MKFQESRSTNVTYVYCNATTSIDIPPRTGSLTTPIHPTVMIDQAQVINLN